MPGGAAVEVRKSTESTTWYNATVLDVLKTAIKVEFDDRVWPSRDVPAGLVRLRPLSQDEGFAPAAGDEVEVRLPGTEATPAGWERGRVDKIDRSFFFVSVQRRSTVQERIVQKEDLRRLSTCQAIDPASLARKLLPVPAALQQWLQQPDAGGCLDDVASRTNLLAATSTTDKGTQKVVLIGDDTAVALGERLLRDIHFKNQIRIQGFHEFRERFLENIKWYESEWGSWHKEEFTVDASFVGRIIGSKGANISRLREEFGVEIAIVDDDRGYEATVTVTGEDEDAVKNAREQMEYVTARIEVEKDKVGWVVGKNYSELRSIGEKANLVYARFNPRDEAIELCGLRSDVDDAKLMIAVHQEYLPLYNDMSHERTALDKEFRELDRKGGKGGKKGGKDGKDGGKKGRYIDSDSDDGYWKGGKKGDKGDKGSKGKDKGKDWDWKGKGKDDGGKGKDWFGKGKDDWDKGKGKGKDKGKGGKKGFDDR